MCPQCTGQLLKENIMTAVVSSKQDYNLNTLGPQIIDNLGRYFPCTEFHFPEQSDHRNTIGEYPGSGQT